MKKLYFLVFFAISFATQAQIVNIPDANFKAKLLSANSSNQIASTETPDSNGTVTSYNSIDINNDGEIQVSEAALIKYLNISFSSILNIEGIISFNNLLFLECRVNLLTTLNLQGLNNLKTLSCAQNQINSLDVFGLNNLEILICDVNFLTALNLQGLVNLKLLNCEANLLTSLDLQNSNLTELYCSNNQLTTLNIENLTSLYHLLCYYNQITSLFIKNGQSEVLGISGNPLQYICCDEDQLFSVENLALASGIFFCEVNSYCSFVPGGEYNNIYGEVKIDYDLNGCDITDIDLPFLKLNQTVSNNLVGSYLTSQSGNYSISVQAGSHTITPVLENSTYFNISPTSFVANFPTQTSPLLQNFCVTPNGVHHDVEATIIPTNPARPGFDANYTIVYKNKGNQVENGAITLGFNDAVLDFISANQLLTTQSVNSLAWNYINLQPLEARTINLVFNVNSPTETPAVNIGDQLNYTATITPLTNDEFLNDNYSSLKQIVVGSYDPNDKTCVEGTTVGPDMIGQYVHYVIRFENTGTYPAENIVVKDMIDLAKFDVGTLIPLHSSHDFVTRIAENKVEFIFEGINLPFDDATNDGYVAFKIKTKSNLVVGDTFSNDANIYFDYNFPITTNTFTTTITALKVTDFDFGAHFTLYPNPVKDVLNFQSKDNTSINSIEIYNTLGQVVLAVPNAVSIVDVSNLQSGNYFVKVNTDLGVSNTKFIKE
jgi:hypothetical protein